MIQHSRVKGNGRAKVADIRCGRHEGLEEFLGRCIDEEERAQRERRGQQLLLEQLDDEVVREYARSLAASEEEQPG